jgi:hypothetical protein
MHNHIFLYFRFSTKSLICTHLQEDLINGLIRFVGKSRVTRTVVGILPLLTRSMHGHTNKISWISSSSPYYSARAWELVTNQGRGSNYIGSNIRVCFCYSSPTEEWVELRRRRFRSCLFLLLSWFFSRKAKKLKIGTNGKIFNCLYKHWKASFWRNELKAKKLFWCAEILNIYYKSQHPKSNSQLFN